MDILRFITCGSVDDGKSTLIGRLLYDSQAVSLDILNAIERQTKDKTNGQIDLSLLTDGLRAEREQGITIDVAYKYFTTKTRKFIIADALRHVQYTRNMVTGASNADLAIVLIDARLGVIEQTRRHSLIASLLGIPKIVVAVNKMDLVGFDLSVFEQIKADYTLIADKLGIKNPVFIPMSALNGDNVVDKSDALSWYKGGTLLEHLESVDVADTVNLDDARFQVQYVIRPKSDELHDYRGYAGRIQSGIYKTGDRVVVLPSGIESTLSAIESNLKTVDYAVAGQSVVLHLADDIDISRGDSIVVQAPQPPKGELQTAQNKELATDSKRELGNPIFGQSVTPPLGVGGLVVGGLISATLCWFDERNPLLEGSKLLLQNGSNTVKAIVKEVNYKLDISNLEQVDASEVRLNDIVNVRLKTAKPIVFDNYKQNRRTGAFILVNENSCNTVAAGMIG
ncbi:MAG: GTP-binding protein [Saprospiraceae bacterium]|nr:GTP-binding protein [Saprospiraceae bacterium]